MELMTAKQVAEVLGCTDKSVRRIANELGLAPAGTVVTEAGQVANGYSEEQVSLIRTNYGSRTEVDAGVHLVQPILSVEAPATIEELRHVDFSKLTTEDKEQSLVALTQITLQMLQATVDDYKGKTAQLEQEKDALIKVNEEFNVLFDQANQYASVKRMEALNTITFPWRPLKDYCLAHNLEIKQVFDANYGKVNTYPREAWEEVYGESYSDAPWL